jgi:hypothetical protein
VESGAIPEDAELGALRLDRSPSPFTDDTHEAYKTYSLTSVATA